MLDCLKCVTGEPCLFEVEITTEKWKRYKLLSVDQILVEVNHSGSETLCSEICKVTNFIWKNEKLPHQWKESILHLFIRRQNSVKHYYSQD
jgi:hypothetical protein